MGYFATFLVLHMHFRHTFTPSGFWVIDYAVRPSAYIAVITWAGIVAYSRYGSNFLGDYVDSRHFPPRHYLSYHSVSQILWGMSIGISFSVVFYLVTELIPTRRPNSLLGRVRTALLMNRISVWLRIQDGWGAWPDGGWEEQWQLWNREWRRRTKSRLHVN
jgi:dolichyldiphosphatase